MSAILSPCGLYRYSLTRTVGPEDRRVLFVMLNPSTADATADDPTIRRCIGYTRAWNFGVLEVVNLFALRSTDPKALYLHPAPIGPENDRHIVEAARRSEVVVCAWGRHGRFQDRGPSVLRLLSSAGAYPHALKITKEGHPAHPLYLKADLMLRRLATPTEKP